MPIIGAYHIEVRRARPFTLLPACIYTDYNITQDRMILSYVHANRGVIIRSDNINEFYSAAVSGVITRPCRRRTKLFLIGECDSGLVGSRPTLRGSVTYQLNYYRHPHNLQ